MRKRFGIFLTAALATVAIAAGAGWASAADTWISRVGQLEIGYHRGEIVNAVDGGYVLAGIYNDGGPEAGFAKFDADGQLVLSKFYGIAGYPGDIDVIPGTGYIYTGNYTSAGTWIAKVDAVGNGEEIFLGVYGDTYVKVSGSSFYLVTGSSPLTVAKFDTATMVLQWDGVFDYDGIPLNVRDIAADAAGNLYVVGWLSTPSTSQDTFVLKISEQGTPPQGVVTAFKVLASPYNDKMRAIKVTATGVFLAGDRQNEVTGDYYDVWVAKLDANLNPVWQRGFASPGTATDWCNSLAVLSDGTLLIGATSRGFSSNNQYDAWAIRLKDKPLGPQILWQKRFSTIGHDEGYAVAATPDGGMILAANHPFNGYEGTILFKSDVNGNIGAHNESGASIPNPHVADVLATDYLVAVPVTDGMPYTFDPAGLVPPSVRGSIAWDVVYPFEKVSE